MDLQPGSTTKIAHQGVHNGTEIRLQGNWLILARIAWVVLALLGVGLLVAALPSYFAYLHGINTTSPYGPQLSPSDVRELHSLGFSLDFYAWLNIAVYSIFLLIPVLVGTVLFWRRSEDRMALLASLSLVLFPIPISTQIVGTLPSSWTVAAECVEFFGDVFGTLFLYLFPSGQFVPSWTRWLMVIWIASRASTDFFPNIPFNNSFLSAIPFVGVLASLIIVQIYRYRSVSTPVQRQQTKWVVFGITLAFGSFLIGTFLLFVLLPRFFSLSPLAYTLGQIPFIFLLLFFPLSIVFAILRNRLWEIDRLINRALVYGILTVSLALVYAGLIISSQALLGTIIKQDNGVAIVISTLAIYALFQPLRRRIQNLIDRRFYRRKYDAARTLAAFSAPLRSEVDLSQLSEQLLSVVEETMQPASVSLWLRPSAGPDKSKIPNNQSGAREGAGV